MGRLIVWIALTGVAWSQAPSPLASKASLPPPDPGLPSPAITAGAVNNPQNLLPDLPSAPNRNVTLVGGTIRKLDRVRDQITLQVFGGGKTVVLFDPRTHIYRNGVAAAARDLAVGDRVYVDTVLDGSEVFARNIHIGRAASTGATSGQIVEHEPGSRQLVFRDALVPDPVRLELDPNTVVTNERRVVSSDELLPGTLVSIDFQSDGKGHPVARQITILAVPGSTFLFSGRVAHMDLSQGLLVVVDPRDQRSWEIQCDPQMLRAKPEIREGSDVSVTTNFDGSHYLARAIAVNSPARK